MLDQNLYLLLTTVIVSMVGIVVPLATLWVKYQQDKRLAAAAAAATEQVAIALEKDRVQWGKNQVRTDQKLNNIETLVDGRLTKALDMIEELKGMLQGIAPNDKRVQALVAKA